MQVISWRSATAGAAAGAIMLRIERGRMCVAGGVGTLRGAVMSVSLIRGLVRGSGDEGSGR